MSNLVLHRAPGSESQAIALPPPRGGAINIREATLKDIPFIDELQKKHSKMVGFMPRMQLETNIKNGHVLIAEESKGLRTEDLGLSGATQSAALGPQSSPIGYIIFHDKYLKREELGIVYHLNIVPGKQRGLVGASLLKAAFERSAYGCKLYCCWCAQDLQANYFWESVGFVPLAFRTGSRRVRLMNGTLGPRTHIFWQRRIREGDTETPYWFPSETNGGAIKENRLVLPILPGTHWSDAKPAVLPGMENVNRPASLPCHSRAGGNPARSDAQGESSESPPPGSSRGRREKKAKAAVVAAPQKPRTGLWFGPPPPTPPTPEEIAAAKAAKKKQKPPKLKNDPKLVEAARELRDRYTEQINAAPGTLLPPSACGKYDVSRTLEAAPFGSASMKIEPLPGAPAIALLNAA